jgi:hypothetical protein
VVLAKKNLGANPVIEGFNKHRFIPQMHRFKSHSKEPSLSESVNQPLQRPHTKGGDLYAHVEFGAKVNIYLLFIFFLVTF